MSKEFSEATAIARFRTICELHRFGVQLQVQKLRAAHPDADDAFIQAKLREWLGHTLPLGDRDLLVRAPRKRSWTN